MKLHPSDIPVAFHNESLNFMNSTGNIPKPHQSVGFTYEVAWV